MTSRLLRWMYVVDTILRRDVSADRHDGFVMCNVMSSPHSPQDLAREVGQTCPLYYGYDSSFDVTEICSGEQVNHVVSFALHRARDDAFSREMEVAVALDRKDFTSVVAVIDRLRRVRAIRRHV